VRDDLDGLEEVVVYEQRVREHEHGLWQFQAVPERPRRLWLKVLNRVVRDVADGAAGERGHLRYLDVLVDGQFPLEGVHRVALDGFMRPDLDHLERIGAYEAVPGDVFARQDGLEQKAVFRVVGDAQIGDDRRDEVGGELDVHGHAITALFLEDQAFEVVERGYGRQHLWVHRVVVVVVVTSLRYCGIGYGALLFA